MYNKGLMALKVLVNRYHPHDQEAFLRFIPEQERKEILTQPTQSKNLLPILYHNEQTIELMHYSWLKPILRQFPKHLLPLLVASLTSEQAAGFTSEKLPSVHLSQPVKRFMQKQLYQFLDAGNHLPIDFLPQTDMTPLVKWDKHKLTDFVDYLGLYDLASEVRHIVDKTQLKNIYTCLSPKQFHYLKSCLYQKEKVVTPPLGIDPAKPDSEQLKKLIHRRGMIRLGKALCGEHPDLIWYLSHIFDSGRGKILLTHYKPEAIPSITSFLQLQVVSVMNFLKSE